MQISVVLTAGFLLGWKGGIFIGLLSILADFGLVYLEINNLLPVPSVVHTPISRWISNIIPFSTIIALQYYATKHLRENILAYKNELSARIESEKIKDQVVNDLGERIKELKTISRISRLLHYENLVHEELYYQIAQTLTQGWQYPELLLLELI